MSQPDVVPVSAAGPTAGTTLRTKVMFLASVIWLAAIAVLLHLHERAEDRYVFFASVLVVATLYPLFWIEAFGQSRKPGCRRWSLLWYSLLPPVRMGLRHETDHRLIWLPKFGWREVNERFVKQVDQALSTPMLVISLLVLPVIGVEYILAERLEHDPTLARATAAATAVIWWAFTIEFVVMLSISEKKFAYVRQHWLDLAIILLPLIAFLRALRLGRLLKLQQLGKTARMYKLRGVAMRTYRALLLVDAVSRLIHGSPQRRLQTLQRKLADLETQANALRTEIAELQVAHGLEPATPTPNPNTAAA